MECLSARMWKSSDSDVSHQLNSCSPDTTVLQGELGVWEKLGGGMDEVDVPGTSPTCSSGRC